MSKKGIAAWTWFLTVMLTLTGISISPAAPATKAFVGIILPDASPNSRWENLDRPLLSKAFKEAGVAFDIENAKGDKTNFQTLADQMLTKGAKVLIMVNVDSASAKEVQDKAKSQGVPTIDYDRMTANGSVSYFASFNQNTAGVIAGKAIVSCLKSAKRTKARIVYLNGPADDQLSNQIRRGFDSVLRPYIKSGAYTLLSDLFTPDWNPIVATANIRQELTKATGKIDAIVAGNDVLALAAITALKESHLNGKVCVTGQDATVEGMRAIVSGDLTATVYKSVAAEAGAVTSLAVALIRGKKASGVSNIMNNGTIDVPSVLLAPVGITGSKLTIPITDGFIKRADLCKGYEIQCKSLGI